MIRHDKSKSDKISFYFKYILNTSNIIKYSNQAIKKG